MAATAAPVFIAPPEAGFAPIEIPGNVAIPTGTTIVPGTPSAPPTGWPQLSAVSETTAVNDATVFSLLHAQSTPQVTDRVTANSFSMTVSERSGTSFFVYTVTETATSVQVQFVEFNGVAFQAIASSENPQAHSGTLASVTFNGVSTQITTETEQDGVITVHTH